jgi:hypothetical protein
VVAEGQDQIPGAAGIGRQLSMGDGLAVHGDRHPVREPARRLGRQVNDGRGPQPLDQRVQPGGVRSRQAEMSPPARAAPPCR